MATDHPRNQDRFLSSPLQIVDDYQPETSPSLWSSLSDDFPDSLSQYDFFSQSHPPPTLFTSNTMPSSNQRRPPLSTQPSQQPRRLLPPISALLSDFDVPSPSRSPSTPQTRASSIVDLTELPSAEVVPPNRKRKAAEPSPEVETRSKGGFTLKKTRNASESKTSLAHEKDIEELDLIDVDDDQKYAEYQSRHQADMIKQQQHDGAQKPVKLASFQCIICLDNPTDLTVTHCGHMFCSICLHEALHAGTQKRACPVCRTTIGIAKAEGKQPKNGFYALEMKLMTSKRKGKQPQRVR